MGEEFAVGEEGVHIADDGIEGDDILLNSECCGGFFGDDDFIYRRIEVITDAEALAEFPNGLGDVMHAAGGIEGADIIFEMWDDGE